MKHVVFTVCGLGQRGSWLVQNVLASMKDITIAALCDPYEDKAETVAAWLEEHGHARPKVYVDHERMLDEVPCDAVLDATAWEYHVEVAVYAMRRGIAVAMEVGGAYNEEECRELIRVYEETKTPIMMMENCCFGKNELLATSLVRNGKLGEIAFCQGAYTHDLRSEIAYGEKLRHYRLRNYMHRNCENYPTHELGPIARLLGITRGNRMVSLSAFASKSVGLHAYTMEKEDLAHLRQVDFQQGDIVETLITCENGELIRLHLDTTLPFYYTRDLVVRGTKGFYNQNGNMAHVEGDSFHEVFDTTTTIRENLDCATKYDEYLPSIWRDVDPEVLASGHGGMDWFVFDAFLAALREGRPMPIDVYDATAWMCITYLSEQSIKQGGAPVAVPDFTDGAWRTRPCVDVVELPRITE